MRTQFLRRISPFVLYASIVVTLPGETWGQTFLERLEARLGEAAAEAAPPPEAAPPSSPIVGRPGYLGLVGDDAGDEQGVVITTVREDSPAARAGFQEGDRVIAVNDAPVRNLDEMARQLERRWVGTQMTFRVMRGEREQTIPVVLGERSAPAETLPAPADTDPTGPLLRPAEPEAGPGTTTERAVLGVRLGAVTPTLAQRYGFTVTEGAVIVGITPGTPAERYRLPIGAVIVDVNGEAIRTIDDLQALVAAANPGDEWEVAYVAGDQRYRSKLRLAPAGRPLVMPQRAPEVAAESRGLGSRLDADGRRPLLGRIGRVLDEVLADTPAGPDATPRDVPLDVPADELGSAEPPPLPAADVPADPEAAREQGADEPASELTLLRDEIRLLRQEVELLRRRVEQLERE